MTGIYIIKTEDMDYIRAYVEAMENYGQAILDESAMIKELLSPEKEHKPMAITLDKVS